MRAARVFLAIDRGLAKEIGINPALLYEELLSTERIRVQNGKGGDFIPIMWSFIEAETTLSKGQLETAFEKLESLGFVELRALGEPARRHFRVVRNKKFRDILGG